MDWSQRPPAEPGFYWMRDPAHGVRAVHVILAPGALRVRVPGIRGEASIDSPALRAMRWRGPLGKPGRWTAWPPPRAGWYWVKGPQQMATVVAVAGEPGGFEVHGPDLGPREPDPVSCCVWAGPLDPEAG
jgi:hypothetical protein